MEPTEDDLDILQNLEASVVSVRRSHPEMTDHVALRAYEAAFRLYRAEERGQPAKPHGLSGLEAEAFDSVKAICDFRLGRANASMKVSEDISPVPVEKIVACLRELCKSVERHTKLGGRQGYLTFIEAFLP